jgi:hypothetical protein
MAWRHAKHNSAELSGWTQWKGVLVYGFAIYTKVEAAV